MQKAVGKKILNVEIYRGKMNTENKTKLKQTFTDWKTYVFGFFPMLLLLACVVLLIVQLSNRSYTAVSVAVEAAGILLSELILGCSGLVNYLRHKNKRNIAAFGILLLSLLAFAVLNVYVIAEIPNFFRLSSESEKLGAEYRQVLENGETDKTLHDAWRKAKEKSDEAYLSLSIMSLSGQAVLSVGGLIASAISKDPREKEENGGRKSNDVLM